MVPQVRQDDSSGTLCLCRLLCEQALQFVEVPCVHYTKLFSSVAGALCALVRPFPICIQCPLCGQLCFGQPQLCYYQSAQQAKRNVQAMPDSNLHHAKAQHPMSCSQICSNRKPCIRLQHGLPQTSTAENTDSLLLSCAPQKLARWQLLQTAYPLSTQHKHACTHAGICSLVRRS